MRYKGNASSRLLVDQGRRGCFKRYGMLQGDDPRVRQDARQSRSKDFGCVRVSCDQCVLHNVS